MIHKLTRALAVMVATGAVAAPGASAMLLPPEPTPASPGGSATQPQVVRTVEPGGFDYGDAAIGAGAVLTLLLAGGGGTLVVHRARRPQMSPAPRA